eukprot:gb/GFBE01038189.1/.p1 GENE.gb/GFBE01038189.1/~~gb/GFBE01038189.1/.p1  ORF type:complete len:399 (+),score=82.93 gb/GFBE01038189.1/:1-1197(+)
MKLTTMPSASRLMRFAPLCFAMPAVARRMQSPSSFMLVSGVSAPTETCVIAAGSEVTLAGCKDAAAAVDGREVWSLTPAGQLTSMVQSKCLGVRGEAMAGAKLEMMECDAAGASGQWELQGNGQVKGFGGLCLSLSGPEAGLADVASSAGAVASSTLDAAAHGARKACDGEPSTYWASKLGADGPVTLTLDLGKAELVERVALGFEFVPQSFSVLISADGGRWLEVFSTDTNVLREVAVPVGGQQASAVKLEMREAHPVHGVLGGNNVFGVRKLAVFAQRLRPVLEHCGLAARSADARDKFFTAAVSSFDPAAGAALRAELPSLEAADAALAAVTAELATAMVSCRAHSARSASLMRAARQSRSGAKRAVGYGLDSEQAAALYQEARATVVAARSVLH